MTKLCIVILLFWSCFSWAQKHDNVWFVGHEHYNDSSAVLDFNNLPAIPTPFLRNLPMDRSSVSICDSLGNLSFFSNSIQVYNSNYQLMQNGDSLNPGSVADTNRPYGYIIPEGSMIVPHPKQANKYYLFHQSYSTAAAANNFAEYLYYTLIDMNANNGLGRVELKNQLLATDSLCGGQLEAVKHGNGKDWWLVQAIGGTNGFYTFLVTEDTIILKTKQYIGNNNRFAGYEATGQAVFSPDGSKYVRYDYKNDLDVFDFDRCIGVLSNPIHIVIQDSADLTFSLGGGGTAISSNNRYLYVSSLVDLYQFDLFSFNIPSTMTTVAHYDYFSDGLPTIFGFLQLAPDGIIYGYANSTRYLHLIKFPDLTGIACDVRQHQIFIHYYNGHFIPNFPHYRTAPLVGSSCDTLTKAEGIFLEEDRQLILYPNPSNSQIIVEAERVDYNSPFYLEVCDITGRVLFESNNSRSNTIQMDVSSLNAGVYLCRIFLERKVINKLFIVEH